MKRKPVLSLFGLFLALTLRAQPIDSWVNWGVITCPPQVPPQIDAVNFVNSNSISIIFTNFTLNPELFDTSDTLNFTNVGSMECTSGWQFDTAPAISGLRRPARSLFNSGTISAGTAATFIFGTETGGGIGTFFGFNFGFGGAKLLGSADYIYNSGTMEAGEGGIIKLTGGDLSLSRGAINLQGTGSGIFDGFWGTGTNVMNPALQFSGPFPFTPPITVTQIFAGVYVTLTENLFMSSIPKTWVNETFVGTNRYVQIVLLSEPNPAISNNVYFFPPGFLSPLSAIGVEWIAYGTNPVTGDIITNYLNAFDEYLDPPTTNNFVTTNNILASGLVTFIPTNLFFFAGGPFFLGNTPAPQGSLGGIFAADVTQSVTNQYAAYEADILPFSALTNDVAHRAVTNLAGRVELSASRVLDLNRTRMNNPNVFSLKSTNHFAGNVNAQLSSAFWDLDLATTNSSIAITNLLMPLARINGFVDLYRARWTNQTDFGGVTNNSIYHLVFIDSHLENIATPQINDFYLRNPNNTDTTISDRVDVMRKFQINARNLTITSNNITDPVTYPTPFYPFGSITFQNDSVLWSSALPNLKNLTNQGAIIIQNAAFFGGQRVSPFISTGPGDWYDSLVNSGVISVQGLTIYSRFLENSGLFDSGVGPLTAYAGFASITNGILFATNSSITLQSSTLLTSNSLMIAGGPLSLAVTNYLDDGSLGNCVQFVTNQSLWTCQGFNLLTLPPLGSLLATTVTNTTLAYHQAFNTWAAADKGADPSGFINNVAVGHIILDGEHPDSLFVFQPATGNNALYVDLLDLEQYATNANANGDYYGIDIRPGMKIYYADARANGVDISEKLNGSDNGRFVWVPGYNCGFFSSVTLTNPVTGSNYTMNVGLRTSQTIDSDLDGIMNAFDLTPLGDNPTVDCPCPPFTVPPFVTGDNSGFGPGSGTNVVSGPEPGQFPGPVPPPDAAPYQTFSQVKGSYHGLFSETNGINPSSAGSFTATTTAKGGVSAKFVLGGHTYSLSTTFDTNGIAIGKISRGALHSLSVRLKLNLAGGDQITGSVSDSRWNSQIIANRLVFDKSHNPATHYVGSYTLDIPGATPDSGSPAGDGFGTVKIDAGGNVQLAGSLADGSRITQKSAVSGSGYWPMYASLYQGSGLAMGWLELVNHRLAGNVMWIKPAGVSSAAKSYSSGFTNRADAAGLSYTPAARNQQLFSWNYGQAILSGAGLNGFWTNSFYLDYPSHRFISDNTSLKLSITPSSGLFQGSVLHPDTGRPIKFQGVLFQDVNVGLGYFLNSDQSGQIYLGPIP